MLLKQSSGNKKYLDKLLVVNSLSVKPKVIYEKIKIDSSVLF